MAYDYIYFISRAMQPAFREIEKMSNYRTTKFTNAEFAALARNDDGDIIDLSSNFMFFKEGQIKRLTGDDFSRVDDYREEVRCMMAEFRAE